MNQEHQRIKIAEACGFSNINSVCWRGNAALHERQIPNYPEDLNAMHEAVKSIPQAMRPSYFACLCRVVSSRIALYGYSAATEATAEQRAEAFLRILDLWEE